MYRVVADRLPGPGWLRGLLFGAAIWLVSGLALPLLGAIHPHMASVLPPGSGAAQGSFPGFLGLGFAGFSGIALSVLAHLTYGVTLGNLTNIQVRRT